MQIYQIHKYSESLNTRPLQNAPFFPISASCSNFNPQNIQYIPLVKIIAFLDFDQNWEFFKGLEYAGGKKITISINNFGSSD
jgi:hypothetical protein